MTDYISDFENAIRVFFKALAKDLHQHESSDMTNYIFSLDAKGSFVKGTEIEFRFTPDSIYHDYDKDAKGGSIAMVLAEAFRRRRLKKQNPKLLIND